MVQKSVFGITNDGQTVYKYTIERGELSVDVMNYGATVLAVRYPDANGKVTDVVCGYACVADYERNDGYLGATVGRVANRIYNGRFSLDGKEYTLALNDGDINSLHGGDRGFDKYVWDAEASEYGVTMKMTSPDGDGGYSGAVCVTAIFTVDDNSGLRITYLAETDSTTLVSLVNHTYFNLNGEGNGSVENHELKLNANGFTPVNDKLVPNGVVCAVEDTPFDFRRFKRIGQDIAMDDEQLKIAGGYDHNFILDRDSGNLCAVVRAESGITLTVTTTESNVQFYSGNFLNGAVGKSGGRYDKRGGLCLETQCCAPNAINIDGFTKPILKRGERFVNTTTYKFSR